MAVATTHAKTDALQPIDLALVAEHVEAPRSRRRTRSATVVSGDRIGVWRVERELGRGGMGAVYAVTHNGFGKRAALKLCHRSVLGPQFTPDTFLREARIVHLVNHPGVPDVFATGTFGGRPYLAMERLSGQTLGQLVDDGPMTRPESIDVLLELCEVLAAAHAAGVIHRDLKLDNVFVLDAPGAGGRHIKLLDWGVARILDEVDPMAGMIAGTLTYVAPEQIRGDALTGAADIYSLGVLAWQLLLGEPPFASASDLDLLRKHLHAPAPAPALVWPEIPPALAALLTGMLDKDPTARPSIDEVIEVLGRARTALRPQRTTWLASLRNLPAAAPFDPFGRAAPVLDLTEAIRRVAAARHGIVGGVLAAAAVVASMAMLFSA
ncbi:MAG: serine/threonine protein kinase [Myxococcota bacterium]|nr:serine/threonine protein kinase [Myxococcota bacterium]